MVVPGGAREAGGRGSRRGGGRRGQQQLAQAIRQQHQQQQQPIQEFFVQAQNVREYEIVVDNTGGGQSLGVCADAGDERSLLVVGVAPGLIQDWNMDHPDEEVRRGDRIFEVNGFGGDSGRLVEECQRPQLLHIRLTSPHPSAAETREAQESIARGRRRLESRTALMHPDPQPALLQPVPRHNPQTRSESPDAISGAVVAINEAMTVTATMEEESDPEAEPEAETIPEAEETAIVAPTMVATPCAPPAVDTGQQAATTASPVQPAPSRNKIRQPEAAPVVKHIQQAPSTDTATIAAKPAKSATSNEKTTSVEAAPAAFPMHKPPPSEAFSTSVMQHESVGNSVPLSERERNLERFKRQLLSVLSEEQVCMGHTSLMAALQLCPTVVDSRTTARHSEMVVPVTNRTTSTVERRLVATSNRAWLGGPGESLEQPPALRADRRVAPLQAASNSAERLALPAPQAASNSAERSALPALQAVDATVDEPRSSAVFLVQEQPQSDPDTPPRMHRSVMTPPASEDEEIWMQDPPSKVDQEPVPQQVEERTQSNGPGLSLTNCWSPEHNNNQVAAMEELLADYEDMPIFADMDVLGSMELMDELPAPLHLAECRGLPVPPGPDGQTFGFPGRCCGTAPPPRRQQQQLQQQRPQQRTYGARDHYGACNLEMPQQQGRPPARPMEDSWFYLDARGQEFGPTPTSAMRELFEGGHFPPGHALLVRMPHWANSIAVGELWPEGGGPPFSELLVLPAPPAPPARPSGRRQQPADQPWTQQLDMIPWQPPPPKESMRFSGQHGTGGGSGPGRPGGKGGWQRGSWAELTPHVNNNSVRCRPQGAAADSWAASSEPALASLQSQDSSWESWSGPGSGRPRNGPAGGRKPKRWPQNQQQQPMQQQLQQQQQHSWQHEQPCHQRQWQHVSSSGGGPQASWPGSRSSNHWCNCEMLPLDDIPASGRQ